MWEPHNVFNGVVVFSRYSGSLYDAVRAFFTYPEFSL